MKNKDSWNSPSIIESYLTATELQKPEKAILEQLNEKIGGYRVLDIGIGTGRTTLHLAPKAGEYVGIDYSFGMIKEARKRFPLLADSGAIRLGDVRLLQEFDAGSFDLVLFSYNGMDYILHEDRQQALEEIRRVLKPGGQFIFSTHNLQYIGKLYSIHLEKGLRYSLYQIYRYCRLILENGWPRKYRNKPYAIINDGAHHFKLTTCYVKPAVQVKQLEDLGFGNIRLFPLKSGEEITGNHLDKLDGDSWVYYWCKKL